MTHMCLNLGAVSTNLSAYMSTFFYIMYSWPLSNTGLNCAGPLVYQIFSVVNISILQICGWLTLQMLNSRYRGLPIPSIEYKLYMDFWLHGGSVPLTSMLIKSQLHIQNQICHLLNRWYIFHFPAFHSSYVENFAKPPQVNCFALSPISAVWCSMLWTSHDLFKHSFVVCSFCFQDMEYLHIPRYHHIQGYAEALHIHITVYISMG